MDYFTRRWLFASFFFLFIFPAYGTENLLPLQADNSPNSAAIPLEWDTNTNRDALIHSEPGLETIVIVGSNDLHGAIFPIEERTRETKLDPAISYQHGGMAILGGYIKNLRQEFGNHMIWLDAGDEFQGSFESNSDQGATMVNVLNQLKLDAAAVGNHEFDFGQPALKTRMQEAHYPYLAANLFLKGTGMSPHFPHLLQHTLLTAGSLKVGIIGLITTETPTATNPDFVRDLDFTELKHATELQAQNLRKSGAELVLLVAHVGLNCSTPKEAKGLRVRAPEDLQGSCQDSGEIVKLLSALQAGTLDAVVSGHTHQIIHHFLSQGGQPIPVIQGGHEGQFLNLIYLTYDLLHHRLLPEFTRIEGPIPVCEKIFANQKSCQGGTSSSKESRGPLVPASFHGKLIAPHEQIQTLLAPLEKHLRPILNQTIGTAERTVDKDYGLEPALGNLVTDAMRKASHADVAITNPHGLRAPLYSGPITFGEIFRAIPFDNKLCVAKVTGQQLTEILQASAQKGRRPFLVSGVSLQLRPKNEQASCVILDGPEQAESLNRVINIQLDNGGPPEVASIYRLAISDFILKGGSGLGAFMKQIDPKGIQCDDKRTIRDIVIQYIQEESTRLGSINSKSHPLVDPKHRRLSILRASGTELTPCSP